MDRRTWLAGSLALLTTPMAATAQSPPKIFRIGLLGGSPPTSPEASHVWAGFFLGLRELGYVNGQNVVIEERFYEDNVERLPALAAELVRLPVDVIVAGASPAPEAAKRATSTIPIVIMYHSDPIGSGLVASLARPGANVTGLTSLGPELRVKQLQLLKEAVPRLTSVAALVDPTVPFDARAVKGLENAARSLSLRLEVVEARAPNEFSDAFSAMRRKQLRALTILGGSMFFAHRARLAELAAQHRLASTHPSRAYAEAGGLMAYGPDIPDNARRAAGYVDRILKGAKPGDLPVEQPTKFELVINRKTARALGLTVPSSLLARADRLLE
jgi:putative ABC transport system substrate-binding protein